ncbi:hypothetical protein [Undibacterium curvum]|uniref:Tip attachment protein J domain-containing protein n=1 Tax=Undibacterium curvum TaxID=2762294 RepID=A0ABR7A572_9BURK|nr:hypothetical protein [Undibacterium curvum]MBC3931974.1 hypothetical protein [Undibacterium curvum]
MNQADFVRWLKSRARRVVLIEIGVNSGGQELTRYLSTGAYNTGPADVPANQVYLPVVEVGMSFPEQLSIGASSSVSSGDIEINNTGGVRDAWLTDIWMNRPIRAWIGDPDWGRADFQLIFSGVVADVSPKGRDVLALKLRDRMQLLNMPLSEAVIGGAGANAGALLPVCFGECHNVTPVLTDPATLEYAVHTSAIEQIIEVRDNGLPVSFAPILSAGRFRLNQAAIGQITCSVQGDNSGGYVNSLAGIVRRILTSFGPQSTRLQASDIDAPNFLAFDQAHAQPMGIYLTERTNCIAAVQQLAGSVGAQLVASAQGVFQLYQISLPSPGGFQILDRHIEERSLVPKTRTDVVAGIKLGYCRNYTVQNQLQTALPPEHKALYAQDYLVASVSDETTRALYRLDATVAQQNTCLLRKSDADIEAARQLAMWKVPRAVYEAQGVPELMQLSVGQPVTVMVSRFGLSAGVGGVVVMRSVAWDTGKVKIGVIV